MAATRGLPDGLIYNMLVRYVGAGAWSGDSRLVLRLHNLINGC